MGVLCSFLIIDIEEEENTRSQIDRYMRSVLSVKKAKQNIVKISEWDCYKRGVKQIEKFFLWNEYTFRYFMVIASICEQDRQSF